MSNNTSEQIQPVSGAISAPTKFVIQAEYLGFPVVVECTGKADILKSTIDRLMSIGAPPPAQRRPAQRRPANRRPRRNAAFIRYR